jgi:hemoglobin/transferrin/lactoferrin receptor protein
MAGGLRRARALAVNVSVVALSVGLGAKAASAQSTVTLDPITVVATKTEEKAIDALAGVSTVRKEQIEQIMPSRTSDLFFGLPGVWFQQRGDNPETSISIRGLQDFGRVAVVVDGARQNFQRTGHNANGTFYLEPELLAGLDIVRGPVANIYGSGAIGGVASFRTKDVEDILRPGERAGAQVHGEIGSNHGRGMASAFGAARSDKAEVITGGVYRAQTPFSDGHHQEVPNSAFAASSGLAKTTFRPWDGHEIKFGLIAYDAKYNTGQTTFQESVQKADTQNYTANARWRYAKPEDQLFDFDGNVYWNRTNTDETKQTGSTNLVTGAIGNERNFRLDTTGFDVHNTSRFDTGPFRHALTIGGDAFHDDGKITDPGGNADVTTPSGTRTVGGAFAQLKSNYSTWLQLIGAARYDTYDLSGQGFSTSGERVSPKGTVGITPVKWFTVYGTYAEGYRSPTLTETVVNGPHVMPFSLGPGTGISYCPGGTPATGSPALFCFLPNTALRPEVGKTKEIGVNIKEDGLFAPNDRLRIKANVFRNDLEDYIQPVITTPIVPNFFPPFVPGAKGLINYQFQNIPNARIDGVEFEANYDAGGWFVGLSGTHMRGKNVDTGAPLASVPPDWLATTIGFRFYDQKITLAMRWAAVAAKKASDIPTADLDGDGKVEPMFQPTSAYNLVNLYLGYKPTDDVAMAFSVENLLNEYYVRYTDALPNLTGFGVVSSGVVFPSAGLTFKGSVQIRFGML